MTKAGIATFPTALGSCAVAWREDRVVGVQLPEADAAATLRRLSRRFPTVPAGEPSASIRSAIAGMQALLRGDRTDLSLVPLALEALPDLDQAVYGRARAIPFGRVVTYGEIAADIGDPAASREVGAALGRNPVPLLVPCHRVVAAGGRLGGFSAAGGNLTKRRLLEIERARPDTGPDLFD
ncbi:MAG: methylated-DNA--[protein]-cysteine S-methyltransferase [Geminicoccaceae bacterium]